MWKDIPYVVLSILIALILLSLHYPVQGGELTSGMRASAQVETGYTSNGTDSAVGEPDVFTHHVETLEIAGERDGTAIRGSVTFDQTKFLTQDIENDDAIGISLAVGQRLSPELVLRGALSAIASNTGDDWDFAGFYIATRTPSVAGEAMVEALLSRDATEIRLKGSFGGQHYGNSSFPNLPQEPFKLQPDNTRRDVELVVQQGVGPVRALGRVAAQAVDVPLADQDNLGRLPGRKLFASLGGEIAWGELRLTVEGGGVAIWAAGQQFTRPFARLRAVATPAGGLSLEAVGETHVELVDNLDAVGSYDRRLSLALGYSLQPDLRALATGERIYREGLIEPALTSEETTLTVGLERKVSENFAYRGRVSRTWYRDYLEAYDKTEFVVGLEGSI